MVARRWFTEGESNLWDLMVKIKCFTWRYDIALALGGLEKMVHMRASRNFETWCSRENGSHGLIMKIRDLMVERRWFTWRRIEAMSTVWSLSFSLILSSVQVIYIHTVPSNQPTPRVILFVGFEAVWERQDTPSSVTVIVRTIKARSAWWSRMPAPLESCDWETFVSLAECEATGTLKATWLRNIYATFVHSWSKVVRMGQASVVCVVKVFVGQLLGKLSL